ncbi:MAG TPA: alpha-glucuronidase family glycosyl hydrolase, partial [Polyangia bacterium]
MSRSLLAVAGLSLALAACGTAQTGATGAAGTMGTGGATGAAGAGASGAGGAGKGGAGASAGSGAGAGGSSGTAGSGGSAGGAGGGPGGQGGQGGQGGSSGRGGAGGGAAGAAGTGGLGGGADSYPMPSQPPPDEDGSQLWLRTPKVNLPSRLAEYQAALTHVVKAGSSATLQAAQSELVRGIGGLTGVAPLPVANAPTGSGAVVLGTPASSTIVSGLALGASLTAVGNEGYLIKAATVGGNAAVVVAANTDVGVLRGSFALLRHLACHRTVAGLSLSGAPKIQRRILDHWDNLDGSIERGYAGKSLWSWSSLPGTLSQRYTDYARANASLGVNGVVLNNVNADAQILTSANLDKVAALAAVFRPYGISVYLSAQFGAPTQIGGLTTADPTNASVKTWWVNLANTIYQKIPDFGGFLVKANSEGQPGPADYGRTHADGANMLAAALAPHGGIVMWRAFVYKDDGTDRIGQAYNEFKPLDGKFAAGTMVQVKNGPLDFQPREPFHPLFGAMPATPLALEVQITKEYLGEDTHLVYLAPMWQEVLQSDTAAKGAGSLVARVV